LSSSLNNQPQHNIPPRVVVIGVGNLLMKDEGIGIHALKALREFALPRNIELIDGGTSPDLIACTGNCEKLIIIDAARAGGEPGSIYRFSPEDLSAEPEALASAHELGVPQNLALMSLLGHQPSEIIIIGIEPGEISPGLELSAGLRQKMPDIVKTVLKELGRQSSLLDINHTGEYN
jgi:hydrogenase maturation protease